MDLPQLTDPWQAYLTPVTQRFNREAGIQLGEPPWELPADLQSLPFWQSCQREHLEDRLGVPFHQVRTPKKGEQCLDLGCGVSFMIYPWSHWQANFYGHELSDRIVKLLKSRAPQLNSKLFKSMHHGPAHVLESYTEQQFDLAIVTGFLYYYPLDYFTLVWQALQPLLRPKAQMIIEIVQADSQWAEEWGLIELAKGTEPILLPQETWEKQIKGLGGKILKRADGELFTTYVISGVPESRRS